MQTVFVLLSQLLQQQDPSLRYKQNNPSSATIMKAEVYKPDSKAFDQSTLYLANCSELNEADLACAIGNVLCYDDKPAPDWLFKASGLNVLFTSKQLSLGEITDALYQAHALSSRASTAFVEIAEALYYGKGLQAIVDIGSKLIGNPMFIVDTGFKALAISKTVPVKNPVIRRDTERGYLDEEALVFMKKRAWFDALQRDGRLLFSPAHEYQDYVGDSGIHEWCYCYVKVNGIVAAYINIFGENSALLEYHKQWVLRMAQLASIELQKDPRFLNNRGAMYEALLTDLLSNRITDQLAVLRRLKLLDRQLKRYLRVITVRKASTGQNSFSAIEQDRIRDFFPGSMSVAHLDSIVLLASSDDGTLLTKEGEALTNQTFTLNGLVAGVSNVFENATETHRYYTQSLKALEFGAHIFSQGKLFYYSDYTVFHSLELCTERMDLRDLCHPGVLKLRESSNPSDRELYQTLYLYLLYMKDVNRVASVMHVHKGTLYYRLKKLQSELGVDLDNGNDVFQLMFSYKLEEYMDIFEPANSPLPPRPSTPEEISSPEKDN